jgi:hypothetical protein
LWITPQFDQVEVELASPTPYLPGWMQAVPRLLICLVLSSSIAFAAVPAPVAVRQMEEAGCCAKMKTESAARECERHAPKSDQDQLCCALCALGCALLVSFATPFVYPPVGDETFAAYISSEHNRSQRPPVPPPRA